jgi:hypothetical protein
MNYQFELFEEKPRAFTGEQPHVSIFADGKIYLNRLAIEMIGAPDAVALHYDRRNQVIGVEGVPPSRSYAFRLHKKDNRSRGRTIAASSFFNRYGIRPTETAAFLNPIVTDAGIMALDLNDAVPTGKKGK